MKIRLLLFLVAASCYSLLADVYRVTSISSLYDHVLTSSKAITLVCVDLDYTLLMPDHVNQIGSEAWLEKYAKYVEVTHNLNPADAFAQCIDNYFAVQHRLHVTLIEDHAPEVLRDLHAKENVIVIGMTSRSNHILGRTLQQLESIDINFEASLQKMPTCLPVLGSDERQLCYKNGIFFCGYNQKGTVLKELIPLIKAKYGRLDRVIMIDDKQKHLDTTSAAAAHHGIDYVGLLYQHLSTEHIGFDYAELEAFIAQNYPYESTEYLYGHVVCHRQA